MQYKSKKVCGCPDRCVHLTQKNRAVMQFYREQQEWFPEAFFIRWGWTHLRKNELCCLCSVEWSRCDGGEQFVQWPPVSHWLRRLQTLASDPVEPAAISGTDAVHPAVNYKVNSTLAAHWASSESRVCSFPAHTQHQCWSSSPACHSSEHPSTCSSPLGANQLFFVLLTFRRLFPCMTLQCHQSTSFPNSEKLTGMETGQSAVPQYW